MQCNLCDNGEFTDMNSRKNVKCTQCGSLERTRLLWMYLQNLPLKDDAKVLHLAPEKGIYAALSKRIASGNYIAADLDPKRYPFAEPCVKIDLCNLDDWPSCEYDLILHSHVLEHTPCNIAYTLFHLHRMLKEDGRHVCIIPFMGGKYDECFQDLSGEERQKRFGQYDHVRKFGKKDIPSHLGSIINVPSTFDATRDFDIHLLQEANIPENHWTGFHMGTVLNFSKDDLRLKN
ncbi:MAG: hypothetical protein Fur0042_29670 [Cyanophyceae cyanobacterium]